MILTSGVFDILHSGHFNLLNKAKKMGALLVCVQSDAGALRSNKKTVLNYEQRYSQLKALAIANKIVKYHSTNDLKKIILKNNVTTIMQGNDYHLSGNRKNFVNFLKKNKIRLILHPRTKNISSTMIKSLILFNKNNILNSIQLKILKIRDLSQYEKFSKKRIKKIYSSINQSKLIHNPITVAKYKKKFIVIDGNNRLQALKLFKCSFAPCLIFDYSDIILTTNTFFFNYKKKLISRASEVIPNKFHYKKKFREYSKDDIYNLILNNKKISSGKTFHIQPYYVINLNTHLNILKKKYKFKKSMTIRLNYRQMRIYYNTVINLND